MKSEKNLPKISAEDDFTSEALSSRSQFAAGFSGANLEDLITCDEIEAYRGNIENMFGAIEIPVGLAGPLLIQGEHADGEFLIPLATTEGSLVASYNRGMKAMTQSGGVTTRVLKNEIYSSVTFETENGKTARELLEWIESHDDLIRETAESTTKHGKYIRSECRVFGSRLLVNFYYDPADAMGINMITSASFAVATMISQENGTLEFHFPSAFQGDKKASFYNFHTGRGRSVLAEVLITNQVLAETLKADLGAIMRYHRNNLETAHLVGSLGFNMHIANGITALGLATGQDIAYVAESANGMTIVEQHEGGLFISLQIPSLYVGIIGGGTALPTSKPCLEMLGCTGEGSALKLAEIFAATALAGEISVLAAVSARHFVDAHNRLGRNRPADTG